MPCGMSSLLVQVTVVPAFTVNCCGLKVKLSIDTALAGLCALAMRAPPASSEPTTAPKTAAAIALRIIFLLLTLQRRVDDREPLLVLLERDGGDAKHGAQPVGGDLLHRSRGGSATRRRLRKRGGAGGVERDVAFDLLHHLVDVAVEHRHRTEALEEFERAAAVFGAPAPIRIDGPERNVGEHDDGG